MKSILLTAIAVAAAQLLTAQNVGIGNSNPQHKLDVSGDVNVTGTIRANGTAGTTGQVLRTNSSGLLEWANPCNYSNFISFRSGSINWNVPAGVTQVLVEVWGPGGGGNYVAGGGGGSYAKAHFTVTPGNAITGTIGTGGTGGGFAGGAGVGGGTTTVTVSGYQISAFGGNGASGNADNATPGEGGTATINPGYQNIIYLKGEAGLSNQMSYSYNGTHYFLTIKGGDGGGTPNIDNVGGTGSHLFRNMGTSTSVLKTNPGGGSTPAGGGGAGNDYTNAGTGGNGMVIIYY